MVSRVVGKRLESKSYAQIFEEFTGLKRFTEEPGEDGTAYPVSVLRIKKWLQLLHLSVWHL